MTWSINSVVLIALELRLKVLCKPKTSKTYLPLIVILIRENRLYRKAKKGYSLAERLPVSFN